MIRFLHAADIHLDSPFSGIRNLPSQVRERIVNAGYQAFSNLIDEALNRNVDFVLFAGDIFDQANRSVHAQLKFRRGLERLSREGIHSYIVHGNHDPLDGQFHAIQWPDHVHIFSSDVVQCVTYYRNGQALADIYGISYAHARETRNLSTLFQRKHERFSIGLFHTNCIGAKEHESYAPCSKVDLLAVGMDYWALGHIHQRQVVHDQPPIMYPGNIQGRHLGEQGEKGCLLVEVKEGQMIQTEFLPLHDLIWLERSIDLTDFVYLDQVHDAVTADMRHVSEAYRCPLLLQYKGVGETELAGKLMEAETSKALLSEWQDMALYELQQGNDSFVWVESFRFQGQSPYDRLMLEKGEGLYADFLQHVRQLKGDEQFEAMFEEICSSLLRHHRARKYIQPFSAEEMVQIVEDAEKLVSRMWMERNKR